NLFNIKKLSGASFYDVHDYRYYMRSLHLPDSEAYDNIVGDDKPGDYRKSGVEYQPIEQVGNVMNLQEISDRAIYYDTSSEQYMDYVNGEWREVEDSKMDQILEDKAYIDMPNQSSFNFLNPRQIFMGIRVSFKIQ
ncbi:MAG: hypothetical protein K9M80_08620, partial [Candidatus Marinimicrobia bacterium]|nr:hypothetical protein [Candidatus Neomarinimicrobiota bacterium]